jgi:transcriptional regulator with XRE-family HTH domain
MSPPDPRSVTETDGEIGARIREKRRQAGVPMSHVAELVGVTVQQFQKYETGASRISATMLSKVADALAVDAMEFLPGAATRGRARKRSPEDGMAAQLQHAFSQVRSKRERRLILDLVKRFAEHDRARPGKRQRD